MTTRETKLRLETGLDQWLSTQAEVAGMAKTKYITQLLEQSRAAHTHPLLSPEQSPLLSPSTSTNAAILELQSRVEKLEQLCRPTHSAIPESGDTFIPKLVVGQVVTGQSAKTYQLLLSSFEVNQKLSGFGHWYLSNKLGVLCKMVGTSKTGNRKFRVMAYFPSDPLVINADGTFVSVCEEEGYNVCWTRTSSLEPAAPEVPEVVVAEPVEPVEPIEELVVEPEVVGISEPTVTREELATILSGGKPNMVASAITTLGSLGGAKMTKANMVKWTSAKDPENRGWVATDSTRNYWKQVPATV